MKLLTARQFRALQFIKSFQAQNGYPPTFREIGEDMGIRSTNGVNDHLRSLERKGYLRIGRDGKSRALRLTPKALDQEDIGVVMSGPLVPSTIRDIREIRLSFDSGPPLIFRRGS
jgi:repressor LexA